MEEDNLPFGKSDSLLINALCFPCWIEGLLIFSSLHLNETLRTDQEGKKLLFFLCEFLSSEWC